MTGIVVLMDLTNGKVLVTQLESTAIENWYTAGELAESNDGVLPIIKPQQLVQVVMPGNQMAHQLQDYPFPHVRFPDGVIAINFNPPKHTVDVYLRAVTGIEISSKMPSPLDS